ncbi:molybdopterin synthase catalytic subunit [Kineosphaera limosa]|uniref:Molybdopterin synthase catalytic subunit n=1 Tax=Kineosphaera limosa NBRC 100340 TaxID=1184609 RepID=K6WTH8_9MICO|nr:molybdenum cofactor biosynthesis protein MoaE [Kineosphaera limosa]NYE02538.1 molybdopterin synthase catalytic subunit [Kineosphaera limosa]GAB97161.1 molybdopterin synthase catalytic subunit [Kineosphaera limosa NBRC 100340]
MAVRDTDESGGSDGRVAAGHEHAGPDSKVRLVAVRDQPLSLDEVTSAVQAPGVGGIVTFTGLVRDHDGGRGVLALGYSAHPSAERVLAQVAREIAERDGVVAVAATHRVGDLAVGDLAVVLAVGAAHRGEAFAAGRDFIDTLKARVPIWKHQVFDDGSDEWVGTP